ncbi:MAG: hypothetical protein AB1792_00480 [Candidatus Zixiibacteriota bacterium]
MFAIMIVLAGISVALKQFAMTTAAAYTVMGAALAMCAVVTLLMVRGLRQERSLKAAAL